MPKTISFNVAMVSVKENVYRIDSWHMSKDEARNRISNSYLKKKVDHCRNTEQLVFFLSLYKRWIVTSLITKEIKKDCK